MSEQRTPFGKWLEKHNITHEEAAGKLHKTRSYITMLASGVVTPSLRLAGAIEKYTDSEVLMQTWLKWCR